MESKSGWDWGETREVPTPSPGSQDSGPQKTGHGSQLSDHSPASRAQGFQQRERLRRPVRLPHALLEYRKEETGTLGLNGPTSHPFQTFTFPTSSPSLDSFFLSFPVLPRFYQGPTGNLSPPSLPGSTYKSPLEGRCGPGFYSLACLFCKAMMEILGGPNAMNRQEPTSDHHRGL